MDYVRHGEIQGRYLAFLKLTALYFTMSDWVHKVLGIVMKELPDVSKNILLKKPKKCLKTPIENCNSTTEVALMCITYSWYVDGVMYPEMFQSSKDTSCLCVNEKGMFFNFLAIFSNF